MNKSSTLLVLVLFVLLLAGGAFLYFLKPTDDSKNEADMAREDAVVESENTTEKMSVTGDFMELLKLGKNYACDFDYADDQGNTTVGKVYVSESGDKLRGEFDMTLVDGTTTTTNILRDEEYYYMWTSSLPQGFKYVITAEDISFFGNTPDGATRPDAPTLDQAIDFDCDTWRVDDSMFEVPSDIEFMDTSSYMNNTGVTIPYNEDPCTACDLAPAGDSRNQCLETLGC